MKKFFIFIFTVLAVLLLYFVVLKPHQALSPTHTSQKKIVEETAPAPTTFIRENPTRLSIEKLGIDANIELVQMDKKGNMDVPKNVDNVAWYTPGFAPGEKGSAVIAGHFDDTSGAPAVFYDMAELAPGDRIQVTLVSGKILTFTVEKLARYPFDNFPLQKVFNTKDRPRLNLITCDGVFDKTQGTYSNRLVVYAVMSN